MSSTHIAIATEGGQVYVAGPNANGQLSLGTLTQTNTFTFAKLDATTNLTSVLQAVDGSAHSLFLRSIGSVYASGLNTNGQLGLGTTVDMSFAALVQQSAGVDLSNVASVAAGGGHSIFLLSGGTVLSCGLNANGQLGDGTTTQRANPVVMNTDVSTPITGVGFIAAGDFHSLVMKSDGTVFGAGLNANGQLGIGTLVNGSYLQQMKTDAATNLTGVTQVAAGGRHSLALTGAGTVFACGANAGGQLATGTTTGSTYGVLCLSAAATTLTGIVQVAAGGSHSLFLRSDGTVLACGLNSVGQLGDGTTVDKSYPVAVLTAAGVTLRDIAAIHATANQSYFLSRDGYIYACGFGGTGAFGVGTTTNSSYAIVAITPSATTLKSMGYSANYARRKGATVANLVTAGFSALEIVCAGYSKAELVAGSITIVGMRTAGVSYKQLFSAGYTDSELVAAGYTSPTITPNTMDSSVFLSGLTLFNISPPIPLTITGNILWLDSTDSTSYTLSGSNVTQWRDKSTNLKHMTIQSGSGPTLSTSNSKTIFNFTNLSELINTTFVMPTTYTIFGVGYTPNTTGYRRMISESSGAYLFVGANGGNFATFTSPNNITWNDVNANTPSQAITSLSMVGMTNNNTNGGLIPYFNGTAQTAKDGSTISFTKLTVGGGFRDQQWAGYIGEVIIYNSVLSPTNRQSVENYLRAKWGIT